MINQLTFTRFIAAFMILFLHFGGQLFRFNIVFFEVIRGHLNLGVGYFFVLSEFVMMVAYGKKDKINPKKYYINRIAKIYPMHLLGIILTIAVSILISINYLQYFQFNYFALFLNLLLIQAWFPSYSFSLNSPAWSISVEAFFYFTFPFFYNYFFSRYSFIKKTTIISTFWLCSQIFIYFYYNSPEYGGYKSLDRFFLSYNPLLHLNAFLIGALFGDFYINNEQKFKQKFDWQIISLVIFTFVLIYFFNKTFFHNGLIAPIFALIITLLSYNTGRLTQMFNNRSLIYLGELSFSMYLLQNPVFIFLKKVYHIFNFNAPYLEFILGFVILLIVCHLTYKYFEVPARNYIRKI